MKFELWIKKFFPFIIILMVGGYLLLSLMAPVLMQWGLETPAKILYWIYSNFCHQFPYRSWFFFGAQSHYPLHESSKNLIKTFSEYFPMDGDSLASARSIIGNNEVGYKIAICQRDVAIYGSILVVSVVYAIWRKSFKKISIKHWFIFGIMPILIDGSLQILSSTNKGLPGLGLWESNPYLRTITGALFGGLSAWFLLVTIGQLLPKEKNLLQKPNV